MADINQFYQILGSLLSIDNDTRVAAEVSGHILYLKIFLLQ